MSEYFNTKLANGKWNHFADQTHIGYTYWQQPNKNAMPKMERVKSDEIKSETKKDLPSNDWVIVPPYLAKKSFIEANGFVSMEAVNFSRVINFKTITWKTIPGIGRTGHGITVFPVNFKTIEITKYKSHLENDLNLK